MRLLQHRNFLHQSRDPFAPFVVCLGLRRRHAQIDRVFQRFRLLLCQRHHFFTQSLKSRQCIRWISGTHALRRYPILHKEVVKNTAQEWKYELPSTDSRRFENAIQATKPSRIDRTFRSCRACCASKSSLFQDFDRKFFRLKILPSTIPLVNGNLFAMRNLQNDVKKNVRRRTHSFLLRAK
jgi:hypothetical protein